MQLCYNGLVRKTSSILLAMLGLRAFALSVPDPAERISFKVSSVGLEVRVR